ncbi:MAG: polysaccharide deacetylase family protein [Candidatus Nitrosotenuis sp.]
MDTILVSPPNNQIQINSNFKYVGLCYHYLRQNKQTDPFPRILGTNVDEFHNHLSMLKKNYQIISLSDALQISYGDFNLPEKKPGVLITFDDGLSDHYSAAKILSELNINAVFFIPTCILEDKLPANPMIIHYAIAIFGVEKFLKEFRSSLDYYNINKKSFEIEYTKGRDNVWEIISKIKTIFKYRLRYNDSRKILLDIYKNLLCTEYSDPISVIHLTENQIKKMLDMGHYIGTHTHSHISVAATDLTENDFVKEILHPKDYLENKFNTQIYSFSYPFGGKEDCLSSSELIRKTNSYKLAFTVEEIYNTKNTSPYELGRYQPTSGDTSSKLNNIINDILITR